MNPAQAETVANAIAKGTQNASAMALANQQGQNISPFDVLGHTVDGLSKRMEDAVNDPRTFLFGDPAQQARVDAAMMPGQWQNSSIDQWIDSAMAQQDALKDQFSAIGDAEGALPTIGATFAFLIGVEQMISTMLSVIPFPAFPAVRITDMDVGLPHAHSHPPNLTPPNPVPVPLPSTGPLIPIPLFSGASQTLINNMPAARCGDMGLGIWCGGYFPMYEIFLGSSNVWIEGARAARIAIDITKHCIFTTPRPSDPPLGPMIGTTISSSANVLIGGVPMPSLLSLGMGAMFRGLGRLLGKGARVFSRVTAPLRRRIGIRLPSGFFKCRILRAEPVNVVTGEVVVDQQDFAIPGRISIEWNRHYGSHTSRMGVCGYGWETPADIRLEIDEEGVVILHRGAEGVAVFGSLPGENEAVMEMVNGGVLSRQQDHLVARFKDGTLYYFRIPRNAIKEILVESIADLHGNYLLFVRDEHGLKQIVESAGRRIEVISRNGLILAMQLYHPDEKKHRPLIRYGYDPETSNLITVYDALDHPYRFAYHNHCLTKHTDRNGLSFYYQYDEYSARGHCIHTWGDGGLYNYHLIFNPLKKETKITNSLGHTWSVEYTDDFLIFRETDPLNGITLYEYDAVGRTSATVDPAGKRTEYHYDDRGNLIKLVRPDNSTIVNAYDEDNALTATIDPNGKTWQFKNEKGLLKKRITPRGAEWQYDYNSHGDLVVVTNPVAARTIFRRDQFGNMIELTNPLNHSSYFVYDALGNLIISVDPLEQKTTYSFDAKNRLIRATYPSGIHARMDYDFEENLIKYKDQNGHITHFKYTGLGELSIKTKPDGTKVNYKYDTEEQLVAVTNERGDVYQLYRDPLGRITQEIDYWSQVTEYTYDPVGNATKIKDSLNRLTKIAYDDLGRILERSYFDGKKDCFAYDANGNLTLAENETTTVIREFDDDNNMVCEEQDDFKIESTYDLLGRRIKRRSRHGNVLDLVYDSIDNVSEMILNGKPLAIKKSDALGRVTEENLLGKLRRTMAYDENGRLIHQNLKNLIRDGVITERKYEYDHVNNLTRRVDESKGDDFFNYDIVNQIVQQINPLKNVHQICYDPAGNIERAVDDPNMFLAASVRATEYKGTRYEYDAVGNMIFRKSEKGEAKFFWDGNNRLVSVINETGKLISLKYDALGRRLCKSVGENITSFIWDGDVLFSEQNNTQIQCREYFYREGTFEPFSFTEKYIYYFENDQIGLPFLVVDQHGQTVWSASYDAFGKEIIEEEHSVRNNIRFQGQYYDRETELSYNRNRYYCPFHGSFISKDPLGIITGTNLYKYAANLWAWIDPLGLSCRSLREARRAAGISRSSHPVLQGRDRFGQRWWEFEVPAPGGGVERRVIVQHLPDADHPFTHYHPGIPKPHSLHRTPPRLYSPPVKYFPLD